jgi:cytoskeletal protein CcmA (bactofilin family)
VAGLDISAPGTLAQEVKMKRLVGSVLLGLVFAGTCAIADEAKLSFGGDEFAAGQSATISQSVVQHDAFVAGYDVNLTGTVNGDAHLAGFNVRDDAKVNGDIYAAGFSVNVAGPIGGDLTAMGNTVNLTSAAPVAGNLRLAGALVSVSASVSGSALVTARNLTLDAPIAGDLNFFGESISFGPNAKVAGKVVIQAPAEIPVPAEVAAADRVSFQQLVNPDYASQAGKTAEHVVNSFWPATWATGLWWLLLFVVGMAFIGLAPRLVEAMRNTSRARPFRSLGVGFLAFATVVGLVPISAITLIGLLVTPLFVLFAVVMGILAYLAGVYLFGDRLIGTLTPVDTLPKRTMVLAVSIIAAGLLGMLPVVGWLVTLLLVAFGYGAIALVILGRGSRPNADKVLPAEIPQPV